MQARRVDTRKASRARYTLEFKQEAVRLVEGGQSIAAAARTLGVVEQTLFNWIKARRQGQLTGAQGNAVSADQRRSVDFAPTWHAWRWSATYWKEPRLTLRKRSGEVRLCPTPPTCAANLGAMPGAANQLGGIPRALCSPGQWQAAPPLERRCLADAHQGYPCRDTRGLRLAAHLKLIR